MNVEIEEEKQEVVKKEPEKPDALLPGKPTVFHKVPQPGSTKLLAVPG